MHQQNSSAQSVLVNLQVTGHWAVRYSSCSVARQHISRALSLFQDNKLVPWQINACTQHCLLFICLENVHLFQTKCLLRKSAEITVTQCCLMHFRVKRVYLERFSSSQHIYSLTEASSPPQDSLTVVVEDLRLCSVKPCEDIERRFCFEVVSPTKWVKLKLYSWSCITSSNCVWMCIVGAVCYRQSQRNSGRPGSRRFKPASPRRTERVQTTITLRFVQFTC